MKDDPIDLTLTNVGGEVKFLYIRLYDGKTGEPVADFYPATDNPIYAKGKENQFLIRFDGEKFVIE
jgi:hypothetical protein